MNSKMSVSVIVPVYNSQKTIALCLSSLCLQDYSGEFEIIVVDDGSTDNSAEIIKNFPVKYIKQPNKGPAAARNNGWRNAAGQIVCFTDSDCVARTNWISTLTENFGDEKVGGVGGTYDIANPENLLARCIHEEIIQRHLLMKKEVNFLGSFNVAYRKKVLEEIGGFNEEYRIASAEDNDLSYRIVKNGYHLIFDKFAVVAHFHSESLRRYLRTQGKHGFWRMKLYKDHPDMAQGDSYSGIVDYIQPPLAVLILLLLFMSVFVPQLVFALVLSLLLLWGLQLPLISRIISRTGQLAYLYMAPVVYLRTFSRGLGMTMGTMKFLLYDMLVWKIKIFKQVYTK